MIDVSDIDDNVRWIKPLGAFAAKVIDGDRVEIPARIRKPLGIRPGDMVELAVVGEHTGEIVSSFYAPVTTRTRVSIKDHIMEISNIAIGDIVTVAILSVFRDRSDGLYIIFDPSITPEWNTETNEVK